ncbi:MAG: helix-turn-helix transcriptional regulator [Kiritimatiellales bacterium]|nr:helix-turn-helix transcriptional regulator [Kiritimatiellales bacterium]
MPTLIGELQSSHDLREAHTQTLLRAILVELKRIVAGEGLDEKTYSGAEKKAQALISDLAVNCDQRWTLDDMATACGIQRTQLNKIFKKMTGGTPMEYLSRLRMERAKTLLSETDMKIIDIAFECGFGTSQYFANTFKHTTGMTPSEYRIHCAGLTPEELQKWKDIDFRSEQEEYQRIKRFSGD